MLPYNRSKQNNLTDSVFTLHLSQISQGLKKIVAQWSKGKGLDHAHNTQMGGNGLKPFGYGFAKKKVRIVRR